MAVPQSELGVEQDDDRAKLDLAQSYYTMCESAAWKDLVEKMEAVVDDAQEAHFKSRDADPMSILEGKIRWQQRLFLKQAILRFVQGQLDTREVILEEMKGIDEHNTADPE